MSLLVACKQAVSRRYHNKRLITCLYNTINKQFTSATPILSAATPKGFGKYFDKDKSTTSSNNNNNNDSPTSSSSNSNNKETTSESDDKNGFPDFKKFSFKFNDQKNDNGEQSSDSDGSKDQQQQNQQQQKMNAYLMFGFTASCVFLYSHFVGRYREISWREFINDYLAKDMVSKVEVVNKSWVEIVSKNQEMVIIFVAN
jgi:AFG3 family protein